MSFIFVAGGALPANHPTYVERHQADYNALRTALSGELLHVIAPRQVGKTSLLKHLANLLKFVGWRCCYVDLSRLIGLTKSSWYAELGKMLASDLTPGLMTFLTNQIELQHYLINQALPWSNEHSNIALLLDEVESVLKARDDNGNPFSDTFFMTLRNLYNERDKYRGKLVIALAGAMSPENLVQDQSISPFNVGEEINLDDFTQTETILLIGHFADIGLAVDDTIAQYIYDWTNGHPYLTQRICRELEKLVYDHQLMKITMDNVDQIVQRTFLASPFLLEKNLRHIASMLSHLSESASKLWLRLQAGEGVKASGVTYQELYLTGAVKAQNGKIILRNRIYEEVFSKKSIGKKDPIESSGRKAVLLFSESEEPETASISFSNGSGRGNISSIPDALRIRLREILLTCGPFDSDAQLRAVFTNELLSPWRFQLPQATSPNDRVDSVISFLMGKFHASTQTSALVILLRALRDQTNPDDSCYARLSSLAEDLDNVI